MIEGTFVFSPLNRVLIENFALYGSFLIISGILLNNVICGLLIRPVPIEPSEIAKMEKRNKKANFNKEPESSNKNLINPNDEFDIKPATEIAKSTTHVNLLGLKAKETTSQLAKSDMGLHIKSHNHIMTRPSYLNMMAIVKSTKNVSINDLFSETQSIKSIPKINNDKAEDVEEIQETCTEKLKTFIDFSLFVDPVFMFFAASNFLTSLGFNAPYIYIIDQAISLGFESHTADMFLSAIGISNTVGRLVIGYLGGLKKVNRLYLYSSVLTICGIATVLEPFSPGFAGFLTYAIVFGFTSGNFFK